MVVAPRMPIANGNGQAPAPPFERSTRLAMVQMAPIARPAGGGLSPSLQIPTNGLLAGIMLAIRGTVGGTVGTVNAFGMASIINRVTLRLNSGTVIFSMTGPNYQYLYRPMLDSGYIDILGQNNATAAVTATGAILDMFIPLQVNLRDPIGMLLLQNRQTILSLDIQWEADANVTSTGTFTSFTAQPFLLVFSVPPNPASLPPIRYIHQAVDDSRVIGGAGDVVYDIPKGNTYMRIAHGAGIGVAGADSWTNARLRVNQSSYFWDSTVPSQDMYFRLLHGRARNPGMIMYDFLGSSGLGSYGTTRDMYDSNRVTDFQSVVTLTGALTFYTVREQLIDLDAA